ncbi:hypothetical protein [Paenibacillus macquariensis]|uniref:Tetratricopeptide repeat-containing protein n=1 Tax=Paenibacillus macquariensis TaxID=948756 RepID=A0ABY1JK17_9BACL|nr:hypothetical protein [Paenibacillus macquariensis]MEC0089841.1 hypothetical protein [Paenibacillus macquariensis]OAB30693.1 hypothetical protein PMSM_21345 [Paenibacillus macquariensis subsp. macquariensis]SIQ32424.1 hypothetical protein SAMN05421578_101221 [Paenibacillus macquariensis]
MNRKELEEQLLIDPFPPRLQYKMGMWYKTRGLHTEALESFKTSLHNSSQGHTYDLSEEGFDKSIVWLEYGKINKWEGNKSEAIYAFQQCLKSGKYKLDGFVEWGDLLHSMGKNDSEIMNILHEKCLENKLSSTLLAHALFMLGIYKESSTLYSSIGHLSNSDYLLYIQCSLHTGEFSQALHLLENRLEELIQIELRIGSFTTTLETLLNLCLWLTNDRRLPSNLTRMQQLDMAKLAICHGLPDESLSIVPVPNEAELSQLIYILYNEGYTEKSIDFLTTLLPLPLHTKEQHSQNLCFIAAEMMYDEGRLQSAAEHFEQIYMNDITHTQSQFATAACYLQITLESLLSRNELIPQEDDPTHLADQYIHNITQSLHILHHTQWHTAWGTAQRRRMSSKPLEGTLPFN